MATNHRTARGVPVDIDRLRLANETSIAVGNMRVNARGDQLGAGGKIIKTRAQVLAEKNKIHGDMAVDDEVFSSPMDVVEYAVPDLVQVIPTNLTTLPADDTPVATSYVKPRGSFAGAVAEQTDIVQELLNPHEVINTSANQPGIKRI